MNYLIYSTEEKESIGMKASCILDQYDNLIIRIEQLRIQNLKNVTSGTININTKQRASDSISSILGIYGPNSSGKTTVILALSILKSLLSGEKLADEYSSLINMNSPCASIGVKISIRNLQYSRIGEFDYEAIINLQNRKNDNNTSKLLISNENLSIKTILESDTSFIPIIEYPLKLSSKKKVIVTNSHDERTKKKNDIQNKQYLANDDNRSMIFSFSVLSKIKEYEEARTETKLLNLISHYAQYKLNIITTSMFAGIPLNYAFSITSGIMPLRELNDTRTFYTEGLNIEQKKVAIINSILNSLFPGTKLRLEIIAKTIISVPQNASDLHITLHNSIPDKTGYMTYLTVFHDQPDVGSFTLPLSAESEGFRRIVAILELYLTAYFDKSVALVIDEIDNGIFEYVLSLLVELFDIYGKGQLIFTCHNLGPIERISRTIYFTSPDTSKRYIQIKNIHATNNLRKMYLSFLEKGDANFWNTNRDKIKNSINSILVSSKNNEIHLSKCNAIITDINIKKEKKGVKGEDWKQCGFFIQAKVDSQESYVICDYDFDNISNITQIKNPSKFEQLSLSLLGMKIKLTFEPQNRTWQLEKKSYESISSILKQQVLNSTKSK